MTRVHVAAVRPGALLLAMLLLALCSPARADWLVTRDGKAIETKGAWAVSGKVVKFTSTGGVLSSLRVDEVDLDASRAETARRNAPPAPAPPKAPPTAPKKPVLVLTDADVGHVAPGTTAATSSREPIVLYTTSWCGYCRKARALLTALGEDFEDKDIEKSAAARLEYTEKGNGYSGIPLIDIDGTLLRGFNETKIRRLVAERQQPAAAPAAGAKAD